MPLTEGGIVVRFELLYGELSIPDYLAPRFRSAHLFFVAMLIFRRVAALSLYPPRL
jgi:hypothetical protein